MDQQDEKNLIWVTEQGVEVKLEDMQMSHLHNSITFLRDELENICELIEQAEKPLRGDCELTDESVTDVYVLRCRKLQIERWQGIFNREVSRRQMFMNEAFSRILNAKPSDQDNDNLLPDNLRRQAE